jgi:hypothetical protein
VITGHIGDGGGPRKFCDLTDMTLEYH